MIVLIVPSILLAILWLRPVSKAGVNINDATTVTTARVGKWGEMALVSIVISPPTELVITDFGFMRRPTWFFPNTNADKVAQMLQSAGVSDADVARLLTEARSEPRIAGFVLTPDSAWVRALTSETRARIYHMLARSELNADQAQAFRYPIGRAEPWIDWSLVSPRTRQLVEPLIYQDDGYMMFSDIELVREEIGSNDEMRMLSKALFRQPTVLALLSVDRTANLDALVEYWGRGGRRSEIRPLIESVAGGGSARFIDISHLLPPFAQNHLYSYPELSVKDLNKPTVVNCLWSSLNFFSLKPDDRFLDAAVALKALKEDYFVVEGDFELGDIVAFLDEEGDIFHAVVYIADNLAFSKNGISAMSPWTLLSIDDVKGYYRWRSENPRLIVHRRKNF
jgi:hypothetical protein